MKDWYLRKPELFNGQPRNQPGREIFTVLPDCADAGPASRHAAHASAVALIQWFTSNLQKAKAAASITSPPEIVITPHTAN